MPKIEFGASEMQPMNSPADVHFSGRQAAQDNGPMGEAVTSEKETNTSDSCQSNISKSECADEISVVSTNIVAITKSQLTSGSSPRYMFIVEVKWSNGYQSYIARDHDDIFRYHCWLLDSFRDEAGHSKSTRQIPLLPGKKFFRNDMRLAEERKPLINAYLNNVIKLKKISESKQAQAFFKRRPGDPRENEPLLQNDDASTDNDSPDIRENSKLYNGDQKSKGCARDSTDGRKLRKDQINGSHDNKTFEPDEDDENGIEDMPTAGKDEEIENSSIEQSDLDATATV